jgi:hypothetical protein
MHCILHIGLEKTGTKTLQEFLCRNRKRLMASSILFPSSPGNRNHRLLALVAYSAKDHDDITAVAQVDSAQDLADFRSSLLLELQNEIRTHPADVLLLSSEHFQSRLRDSNAVARFKEALLQTGCSSFRIIIYLRDPVEIARSLYASAVVTGSTATAPPEPDNTYFRNICDHRATIERWSSVFGIESLTPRLFDRASLFGGSIIDDFCNTAGIDLDSSWHRPEDRNQSISALGLALMRRLNQSIPRLVANRMNPDRTGLAEWIRRYCSGPPYELPEDAARAYRLRFAKSDEWVRVHFFPERPALFKERALPAPGGVCASDDELDALADLVSAMWKEKQAHQPEQR